MTSAFQLFLLSNLLVVAGFAANRLLLSASPRGSLRISQFLVLFTLALPYVIPNRAVNLPTFDSTIRKPLDESFHSLRATFDRPMNQKMVTPVPAANESTARSSLNVTWFELMIGLLVAGVAFGYLRLARNLMLMHRHLKYGFSWKRFKHLRIVISTDYEVPFSLWFFGKRWVVIPQSLMQKPEKLRLVTAHEIAHHRANDTVWAFAIEFVSPFFIFNPFFAQWKTLISELQEFSCDEFLIGRRKFNPRKYGDCLLTVAEASLNRRLQLVGVAGMANYSRHAKTSLERRIRMFKHYSKNRPRSYTLFVLTVGTSLSLSAMAFALKSNKSAEANSLDPNPGIFQVDPHIQEVAATLMKNAVENFKATSGFAIVEEAKTGRVLAVANMEPDPSIAHSPHWALGLHIEPASVIKAVVAAAAIDKGATRPDEMHNCENGKLLIGGKEYGDWKPFDKLSTEDTVTQSSNICGIKVGRKIGAQAIRNSLEHFGFGLNGITKEVPEARPGIIPTIESIGEEHFVAGASSGFKLYVSPLEIVQFFGAVANGGNLLEPIQSSEQKTKIVRRILSSKTAESMRSILANVMVTGTAKLSQGKKYKLAGKTGTGYGPWLMEKTTAPKDSQIAHFVGFGPVEDPELVVYVAIQDPKNGPDHKAHGSEHAAPVFREIIEKLLDERRKSS